MLQIILKYLILIISQMNIPLSNSHKTYLFGLYKPSDSNLVFDLTTISEYLDHVYMIADDNFSWLSYGKHKKDSDFTELTPNKIYYFVFRAVEESNLKIEIPNLQNDCFESNSNHISSVGLNIKNMQINPDLDVETTNNVEIKKSDIVNHVKIIANKKISTSRNTEVNSINNIECGSDIKKCGDGTLLMRNPDKNCEFDDCEETNKEKNIVGGGVRLVTLSNSKKN